MSDEPEGVPFRLALLGIIAVVALAYATTLRFHLVYDDGWTLISNGLLRHPEDLGDLFTNRAALRHVPDAFRPTLVAFDSLCYALFGLSAPAHHAVSIGLHVAVTVLLVVWLRRLGAPDRLALATGALFGVLAIHAEAVAVVSFHEDLLAAALGLGAVLLAQRGAWWRYALATLFMVLACGAKLSALPLFVVAVLAQGLDPFSGEASFERPRTRQWVPVALCLGLGAAVALGHRAFVVGGLDPYGAANLRVYANRVGLGPVLAESVTIQCRAVLQMIVPVGLSPEYIDRGRSWTDPGAIACSLGVLGSLGYGVWASTQPDRRLVAFVILATALLVLPTSNLFGMPNMRADRFAYLPSAPVCVGVAALLLHLGDRLESRFDVHALLPIALVCVAHGAVLQRTATVYATNAGLWSAAAERAPGSARSQALLGLHLLGRVQKRAVPNELALHRVRAHCRNAERLDPHYELSHLCFARLHAATREWERAHARFARALEISPDRNDRILASLAQVELDRRTDSDAEALDRAKALLTEGLIQYPYSPEIHVAAATVLHRSGEPESARRLYRRARSLRPERWQTVVAALELALDLGDAAAAWRTWWQAQPALAQADPPIRAALLHRLLDAHGRDPVPLIQSFVNPGAFSDDP